MRFYKLVLIAGVVLIGIFSVRAVYSEPVAPSWISTASPAMQKTSQLPSNVFPSQKNIDCQPITTRFTDSTTMQNECVVPVPLGLMGQNGMIFEGSSEAIKIRPPDHMVGLYPVRNQPMMYTYSSAPLMGMYIHFYQTIYDRLELKRDSTTSPYYYQVTGSPDISLRDANGVLLRTNTSATAFSANGHWLVTDVPGQGFIRVNMATFQMTAFAPTLNAGTDTSHRAAQLTISNDGRFVAIKPVDWGELKVYDMATCDGTPLPVNPSQPKCSSRDYWQYLNGQLPTLRALYQPRFTSSMQISFKAVYDYVPGSFSVGQFVLAAPGESFTGIPYLGMGDSFAAGQGAFNYVAETDTDINKCHLSSMSYPKLFGSSLLTGGQSIACSGAKTNDLLNTSGEYTGQVKDGIKKADRKNGNELLAAFSPGYLVQSDFIDAHKPEVLTLSIGGNDIGFSDILSSCVSPASNDRSCYPAYEDQLELYQSIGKSFDRLVQTYNHVKKPGKRVYVVGYPHIAAAGGDCGFNVQLDAREIELAVNLTNHLNSVISQAASKAGVFYVDVSNSLNGHQLCENTGAATAVNGFTLGNDDGIRGVKFVGSESYHPNALGHQLMERTIRAATDNLTAPMPAENPAATPPPLPAGEPSSFLPKTGRTVRQVVRDTNMAPDAIHKGSPVSIKVSPAAAVLKPNATYTATLHSDPVTLGTLTTTGTGELSGAVTLPADIAPGIHTLHIFGVNMTGQPLDITKTVYVAASTTDYDGDGVLNDAEACLTVPASGTDADKDGIDDACDADLATVTESVYRVKLTGNSIGISAGP